MNQWPNHFVDGLTDGEQFTKTTAVLLANTRWLSDDEYELVLDNVVVACVDVALRRPERKFLLGVRKNEPFRGGVAFNGGKMKPGESFHDTAARHAKRDFGLAIAPKRFLVVRTDSWAWSRRAQEPQDHGCHMTGTTLFAEITAKETAGVQLLGDSTELRWLTAEEISAEPLIHPAHQRAVLDIIAGRFQS